jgi:hypothetical protein
MKLKLLLSLDILKNIGRFLSPLFWKATIIDPDHDGLGMVMSAFRLARLDIYKMIFLPGYPPGKEAAE